MGLRQIGLFPIQKVVESYFGLEIMDILQISEENVVSGLWGKWIPKASECECDTI